MSQKRIHRLLIAGGLITLVAVVGTESYVVRDLLAAFLIFCALFGGLGIISLVSFLIGDGIEHCFQSLVAYTVSFGVRERGRSVARLSPVELARVRVRSK